MRAYHLIKEFVLAEYNRIHLKSRTIDTKNIRCKNMSFSGRKQSLNIFELIKTLFSNCYYIILYFTISIIYLFFLFCFIRVNGHDFPVDFDVGAEIAGLQEKIMFPRDTKNEKKVAPVLNASEDLGNDIKKIELNIRLRSTFIIASTLLCDWDNMIVFIFY